MPAAAKKVYNIIPYINCAVHTKKSENGQGQAAAIFGKGDVMQNEIFSLLIRAFVLLTALPLHEFCHVLAARLLGDTTAFRQGRFSLNPLAHIDPLGAVCFLAFGLGWAKPVPVATGRLRHPRLGGALVAAAGPAGNFALAVFSMLLAKVFVYLPWQAVTETLALLFFNAAILNITLGVFNLMPFAPFDGGRILQAVLPRSVAVWLSRYETVFLVVVLALVWVGAFSRPLNFCTQQLFYLADRATAWVDLLALGVLG